MTIILNIMEKPGQEPTFGGAGTRARMGLEWLGINCQG